MAHQATPLNLNEKMIAFSLKVKWSVNDQWNALRFRLIWRSDEAKSKKKERCLTVGAALEASPSHRRPLQVGLDPRLQAHVLLLHGIEGVAHRVHHLHHVDLAVWQQLQCGRKEQRRRSGSHAVVSSKTTNWRHLRLYYCHHHYHCYLYVSRVGSCCCLFSF